MSPLKQERTFVSDWKAAHVPGDPSPHPQYLSLVEVKHTFSYPSGAEETPHRPIA